MSRKHASPTPEDLAAYERWIKGETLETLAGQRDPPISIQRLHQRLGRVGPLKNGSNAPITVTVPINIRDALIVMAQEDHRSLSNLVARIFSGWTQISHGLDASKKESAWIGFIQTFLEERIKDAPDETCRTLARNLWQETAELEDD